MVKLGIYYAQDDEGKDTGIVQVADAEDEVVYGEYDSLEEAERELIRLQAESDRDDKIEVEYRQWEKDCMARHDIGLEELRVLLANGVVGEPVCDM